MLDTVFGLPTHVLVIHAVVAGIPLAALATAVVSFRPSWRRKYGLAVLVLDVLVVIATYIARQSGLKLYARLGNPSIAAHHRALGLSLIWFMLGVLAVAVVLVIADRFPIGTPGTAVLAVIAVAVSALAVVRVVQTGDAGARAVWRTTVQNTHPR